MCAILNLQKGFTPRWEEISTAVFNNPHGYGLVLKDANNHLDVIKWTPNKDKTENDPKEIYDLLKDNEDVDRYLHLRWKTDGEIIDENQHPFSVYNSNSTQVLFMHNGVLHDFKPKGKHEVWNNSVKVEVEGEDTTDSDSKRFADRVLSPLLLKFHGNDGKGDIHDPLFASIVDKYWGYGDNKGILISNRQEPLLLGASKWVKMKSPEGIEWLASNDSYFKEVKRGPEKDRRDAEKKAKEDEAKKSKFQGDAPWGNDNRNVVPLKQVSFQKKKFNSVNLSDMYEDWELWDDKGMAALVNATDTELEMLSIKDPVLVLDLLSHILGSYKDLYDKHQRAAKYLAEIQTNGSSEIDVKDVTVD